MRVLFVGPPGAGKGTQAHIVADRHGIPIIASGDLLRSAVKDGTSLGVEAKKYMERGDLVPDKLMVRFIEEEIRDENGKDFILDGFPRTSEQARALDELLVEICRPLEIVIELNVPDDVIIERLGGRRTCPTCQRTYHLDHDPPKFDDQCDVDATPLVVRKDDDVETVNHRLKVYRRETAGLLSYYEARDLLERIDGVGSPDEVGARVGKAIEAGL